VLEIEQDSILVFKFANILLPATEQDPAASHGYIVYALQPTSPDLEYEVNNTASIFFDYNKPVRTNTANTKVINITGTKTNTLPDQAIAIYPNPTSNFVNIDIKDAAIKTCTIQISDMTGRKLFDNQFSTPHGKIDVSSYSSGIYLIQLISPQGTAAAKLRVE
jgi:hypothetical protein